MSFSPALYRMLPLRNGLGLAGGVGAVPVALSGMGGAGPVAPSGTVRVLLGSFQPAPLAGLQARGIVDSASKVWVRQVAEASNNALQGKINVNLAIVLGANVGSTTITDARISSRSSLLLTPLTANAAAALATGTVYISAQQDGEATVTHQNNAQTDRSFRLAIIG